LDDLVFDASKGKKAIESALSEFLVIVGAEDVIGGPRMLGKLWLVQNGGNMETFVRERITSFRRDKRV